MIDVRLTAGPLESGGNGWAVLGTLTSRGAHPWARETYWQQQEHR